MKRKLKQAAALLMASALCFCSAGQAAPISSTSAGAAARQEAGTGQEAGSAEKEKAKTAAKESKETGAEMPGKEIEEVKGTESTEETGSEKEIIKETEDDTEMETDRESETEKPGAGRLTPSEGNPTETENEPDGRKEAGGRKETEKDTGEETGTKNREPRKSGKEVSFQAAGDAYVNLYYGIREFQEAVAHQGIRRTFTRTCSVDLEDAIDGKVWVYAQGTGELGYSGVTLPQGATGNVIQSMPGMGGHVFLELDFSGCEEEKSSVSIGFFGAGTAMRASLFAARASGSFNTATTKKLTNLTYTWRGGQPSMYEKNPATGESQIWGNGTWSIARPSLDALFSLFGVEKPAGARYTDIGTDGNGQVYMRCTGVADNANHSGLGAGDAFIRCIDLDEQGENKTYTFRIWGANSGRGQTTEGYLQVTCREATDADIQFEKAPRVGTVKDLFGNTFSGNPGGARFRLFKLSRAGADKIAGDHNKKYDTNSAWWQAHTSKDQKKAILTYVEKLMLAGYAAPGDDATSKNPNPSYFAYAGTYTTGPNGKTDMVTIDSGASDYYVVFERKSPDNMNMGYTGHAGVPGGKHYFYKVFSVYGGGNIIMKDAAGNESKDTDNDLTVKLGDDPLLADIRVKKSFKDGQTPDMKGLGWGDIHFLAADNAAFAGAVSIPMTGEMLTIQKLFAGKKYYLKEDPDSPACTSDVGYKVNPKVVSFYPTEDGKVVFSDTYPEEVDAQQAVDAYEHEFIGIENDSEGGSAQVVKISALPDISDGNCQYSLAGATYEIYQKATPMASNTGGTFRGTLVTDEKGMSNVLGGLPAGYYYAVETAAPKGFALNTASYPFVVAKNQLTPIQAEDVPLNDPVRIQLTKVDSETGGSAKGNTGLAGAEYTIRYYKDGFYSTAEELEGKTPTRSWVFATKADGKIDFKNDTPVFGDIMYRDIRGEACIPIGTVCVQETKAPTGYRIDDTAYVANFDGTRELVFETGNEILVREEMQRGDFRFRKRAEDGSPLAGIPFRITSGMKGESHVMLTDAEGFLDTSKTHSRNTNRGETAEDGVWFGELSALDDGKGALPYGTYQVEEILCEGNKDKFLLEPFTVDITGDSVVVNLGDKENKDVPEPQIKTTATDNESKGHEAFASGETTVTDVVEYANLQVGKEYTIEGYLVRKETGKPLLDAGGSKVVASRTFTVPETEEGFTPTLPGADDERLAGGTVELAFTFDSSLLKGKDVVVFEDLRLGQFHVASHADIEDEGQTVHFKEPQVRTTATDKNTGKHYAPLEPEATIVDQVEYKDLIAGDTYSIKGILMDGATGEPLKANGEEIVVEKEFTPSDPDGSVEMEYILDSRQLANVTAVVFETLYYQGREVASHADINDEGQTVYFTGLKLKTTATDRETGLHEGIANKATTIVDTVHYTGLEAGRSYTVKGVLMEKTTGQPLTDAVGDPVENAVTFTAEQEEGDVELTFTFDSSQLADQSVVVFETMYQDGKEVGVHADIEDDSQTVTFKKPGIETMAADRETKDRVAFPGKETVIIDTVSYQGLVCGVEYRLEGVLMDKATGNPVKVKGKDITAHASFTPDTPSGEAKVTFTLDATSLAGRTIVAFETLYLMGREVASHKDLEDGGQTVRFADVRIKTTASDAASGTKEFQAESKVTVLDKVSYSGLVAGETYTVKGVLMDKETGKALIVDGKEVTAENTFRAEKANGSVEMAFTFEASALAGKMLVAFERLSYKGREIAAHTDLEDGAQTVKGAQKSSKTKEKILKKSDSSKTNSPKTGDDTPLWNWILLAAAAAYILYIGAHRKRRKAAKQ